MLENGVIGNAYGKLILGFENKTITVNNELFAESFTAANE